MTVAHWLALAAVACVGAPCLTVLTPRAEGGEQQPTGKRAKPDEIVTIIVPSTAPWTDTGIHVSAGDTLQITTWGRVRFDEEATASATPKGSGLPGGGCTFVVTDRTVGAHSVIGNVASSTTFDGRGFYVGPGWKRTVPIDGSSAPEGRLFLGFNDGGMLCDRSGYDSWAFTGTNSGWFTAEIAITRAR